MLEQLKASGEAPEWLTPESYDTISKGYLLKDETPRQAFVRISEASAKRLGKPEWAKEFFKLMFNNWLGLASPVFSNMGTDRGLPISCFSLSVPDSINGIFDSYSELAAMTKNGGGVGVYWGKIRPRGATIKGNGKSEGCVPWIKIQDSVTIGVAQGSVRRGATAAYIDIEHPDFEEFIRIRRPQGDVNRQCLNIHHGVVISDNFMNKLKAGDEECKHKWRELMKTRYETGEPYLMFGDTANRLAPQVYKDRGLKIETSNICNEIYLTTDDEHSFVCCLSSLNLAKWDEWKDTDCVYWATIFLDGVMQEFIDKAKDVPGLERAHRFAIKSRALGIGVLGWHTLLQKKMLGFEWISAHALNRLIFEHIDKESLKASQYLAKELGEPEWLKGYGLRNTHRMAVAPTVTNSIISGNVSAGIEPWSANVFTNKTAKGTFVHQNKELKELLTSLNKNTPEVWREITINKGSVQHLDFLTTEQKEVFKTAREIDQSQIVKQASQRQKFIDQGQSVNLFFNKDVDLSEFSRVHFKAWESGLKGLYYCRMEEAYAGDVASRENKKPVSQNTEAEACVSCEG
jgi:ribonucleoside-diphosphate reductase alpha chain